MGEGKGKMSKVGFYTIYTIMHQTTEQRQTAGSPSI